MSPTLSSAVEEREMTTPQLAEYAGVSEQTAHRWIVNHGLPSRGAGNKKIVDKQVFLRWVAPQRWICDEITKEPARTDIAFMHESLLVAMKARSGDGGVIFDSRD